MTIEKFKRQAVIAKHWKGSKLTHEAQKLHDEVEAYINSIDDPLVKEILYTKYILGKSWTQVAGDCGLLYAGDCYRKIAERYLAKHLKKGGADNA